MNGPHDLGGLHGLGPIVREADEPVFHDDWERRAFALTIAMGLHGRWTLDRARHVRENRHPVDYLSSSYYEIWFKALESLVVESGLVTSEELAAGRVLKPADAGTPAGHDPGTVAALLKRGFTTRLPENEGAPARFRPGDPVSVREMTTPGHTRAPRYCRGRRGIVDRDHGVFIFPDTNAHGGGRKPQHVYSVRFDGRTLWGDAADPNHTVYIDLWDDYLEPAP